MIKQLENRGNIIDVGFVMSFQIYQKQINEEKDTLSKLKLKIYIL